LSLRRASLGGLIAKGDALQVCPSAVKVRRRRDAIAVRFAVAAGAAGASFVAIVAQVS
jgi:hypothetical protein